TPASDRRGGKRSTSQDRGSRNQRARVADSQENDIDPIEEAVSIVEVPNNQRLAANIPQVAHAVGESIVRQGWTPALSCAVACEMLMRAGCPGSLRRIQPQSEGPTESSHAKPPPLAASCISFCFWPATSEPRRTGRRWYSVRAPPSSRGATSCTSTPGDRRTSRSSPERALERGVHLLCQLLFGTRCQLQQFCISTARATVFPTTTTEVICAPVVLRLDVARGHLPVHLPIAVRFLDQTRVTHTSLAFIW
ncbi:unnamed protein product, partial [Ectocarpus sp. 13 AM-2016]